MIEGFTRTTLYRLSDGLYEKPPDYNPFEAPDVERDRRAWKAIGHEILLEWIRRYPCSRPAAWWKYAAPEMRQRLGGIGDPTFMWLNDDPDYHYGLPVSFLRRFDEDYYNGRIETIRKTFQEGDFEGRGIDPENPPVFESQAAYLQRLNLLTDTERLFLADNIELLEPEAVYE